MFVDKTLDQARYALISAGVAMLLGLAPAHVAFGAQEQYEEPAVSLASEASVEIFEDTALVSEDGNAVDGAEAIALEENQDEGGIALEAGQAEATVGELDVPAVTDAQTTVADAGQVEDAGAADEESSAPSPVEEAEQKLPEAPAPEDASAADAAALTAEEEGDVPDADDGGEEPSSYNMYRLYNPYSGEHFYTSSLKEAKAVATAGWRWEGVGWVAPGSGDEVYRLYNPYVGDHHYTVSQGERDDLVLLGWVYEGVGWYSGGKNQVLRQYNPHAEAGAHNFTLNDAEDKALAKSGWTSEGAAWLAAGKDALEIEGFWLICSSWGSPARYWVGKDCAIAVDRLVTASEGAGYAAYATMDNGAILRGSQDLGNGTVMVADNDGRLATKTGFVTASDYGAGKQLYYLSSTGQGYSVAKSGHLTLENAHYWGRAMTGAILCGKLPMGDVMLVANPKTGKLAWTTGWCITKEYDGAIERYYLISSTQHGLVGARLGAFTVDGKRYYGRDDQGYVARGAYVVSRYYGVGTETAKDDRYHDDTVVIADNDGVLLSREEAGAKLVQIAKSQIGASYDYEGSAYHAAKNPQDSSFNCSGFTWWVYSMLGLNISHNQGYYSYYTSSANKQDSQMWGVEKRGAWKTKIEDLVPGDLVFFTTYSGTLEQRKYHTGHVGVYVGNGLMVDANTTGVLTRKVARASFVGGGTPITLIS